MIKNTITNIVATSGLILATYSMYLSNRRHSQFEGIVNSTLNTLRDHIENTNNDVVKLKNHFAVVQGSNIERFDAIFRMRAQERHDREVKMLSKISVESDEDVFTLIDEYQEATVQGTLRVLYTGYRSAGESVPDAWRHTLEAYARMTPQTAP